MRTTHDSPLALAERMIDKYTDMFGTCNTAALSDDSVFHDLAELVTSVSQKSVSVISRLFDLVVSAATPTTCTALVVMRWIDLVHTLVVHTERRMVQDVSVAHATAHGPKRTKYADWDWAHTKLNTLNAMRTVLDFQLEIFLTETQVSTLLNQVSVMVHELWHNRDRTSLKDHALKRAMFALYAQCIVVHGLDAQISLEQNLKFFDFLAEPTAEFVAYLITDHNHSNLALEMLNAIGQGTVFGDSAEADSTYNAKHVKSVSVFLTTLTNLVPKTVLKSLVYLQDQLENPEYTLRCAVLHSIATCIRIMIDSANEEDQDNVEDEAAAARVTSLLAVIEERFRDVHAMVRKKAVLVVGELVEYMYFYARFPLAWLRLVELAVGRLVDKNQPVRLAAIRTVTFFLVRHPFTLHGTSLDPEKTLMPMAEETRNKIVQLVELLEQDPNAPVDTQELSALEIRNKYCSHALHFARTIEQSASPALVQLLGSKSKPEILDAMEFFVEAQGLGLQSGVEGLRHMWKLVFNVRNTEFVKDVHAKLVECFRAVYLTAEGTESSVRNLIMLTYGASLADFTCLEKLVGMCVVEAHISPEMVELLWAVLVPLNEGTTFPAKQQRGAAVVLSWVYRSSPTLLGSEEVAQVFRVLCVRSDDALLARSCCLILANLPIRIPASHDLFKPLTAWLVASAPLAVKDDDPWYSMAQQVIQTVFAICQQPIEILDRVLRSRANVLTSTTQVPVGQVCRLLFILGHTAIQTLVFLECAESLSKKKQQRAEVLAGSITTKTPTRRQFSRRSTPRSTPRSRVSKNASDEDTNMDGVVGSIEDLLAENFSQIRELELLSGAHSILAVFVPVIVDFVSSPSTHITVRQFAAVTLAQFMCISPEFCETHLPLLMAVLNHPNSPPVLKSNLLIAMGDLIVSFSTVIGDQVHVLYDALRNPHGDPVVKKNALMVLLHLILNGMVKVKGHLSVLAMCLEDPDARIAGLTRLFLAELAGKEQVLYNNLSDALSHLLVFEEPHLLAAADDSKAVSVQEEMVMRVLKHLFSFISKDKQVESLIEKLCVRLRESKSVREWRVISYAMTLLPWETSAESKAKKIGEYFMGIADKLHEEAVYENMYGIALRVSKAWGVTAGADELVGRIERVREQGLGAELGGRHENPMAPKLRMRMSISAGNRNSSGCGTPSRVDRRVKKPERAVSSGTSDESS